MILSDETASALTLLLLQQRKKKNRVKFGLNLLCCISMTGNIVVDGREKPLLWETQTHAAEMLTHTHIHTHVCHSAVVKSSTIRGARYNGVV